MPLQSDVHVDQLLTNLSIGWMNDPANYIASKVFPNVSVDRQSNKYRIFNKNDWFRSNAKLRADTAEASLTDYTLSSDTYFADVYALKGMIGDQTRANFDGPGNLEQDLTRHLTDQMLLQKDIQFTADFLKTSVWGLDKAGVASGETGNGFRQWNDYANSDPILDVEKGKTQIASATGFEANTLVLGRDVLAILRNHPDVIDRINYTGNGGRNGGDEAILAGLFGVDRILIARAIKATNAEGATAAYSKLSAAKQAFLCYSAPSAGLMTPTAGLTFTWSGVPGGNGNVAVKRYRDEPHAADVVEVQTAYDNKVVAPELGVFYDTVIA